MNADYVIDVAVAVIIDSEQRILVSQRTSNREHAGLWEFPGGKFEKGESISQALVRECQEELGITIKEHVPLMVLKHSYPKKIVKLDVQIVMSYVGDVSGLENQNLAWHSLPELHEINLLPADLPILHALENIIN